ncbi:MAG: PD40 domain-containing protein, partial [Candidatus Brocadiae bacterium]|nr:PD40 domain-containing protein [Candidatus Brocadiia bacterium]
HPDGKGVFYAASPSLGERFDLWELKLGRRPARLTEGGGQMPDCSPDGRHLAFVSARGSGEPDLWLLRLADGTVARLTSGPELDLYPCWSADGRRVFFSRIAFDTNRDGRLDQRDASAIFSVSFSEQLFAGDEPPPPRQLTTFSFSDGFPRPVPGGFTFTRAVGDENTDVFALGESGEMPDFSRVSQFMAFARRADVHQPADLQRCLLAWRNAAWAGRSAQYEPEVEFDLPRRADAAAAWLRTGGVLLRLGWPEQARRAFEDLVAEFPDALRYVGSARVELLALDRLRLTAPATRWPVDRGEDDTEPEAAWQDHLAESGALRQQFLAHAERARSQGADDEATALGRTAALAQLEIGYAHLARKGYAKALEALEEVAQLFP